MTSTLLVFVPRFLRHKSPCFLTGTIVEDEKTQTKKIYILQDVKSDTASNDAIGYFSGAAAQCCQQPNVGERSSDWINIYLDDDSPDSNFRFCLGNSNRHRRNVSKSSFSRSILIIYDRNSFLKTQIFDPTINGDHFSELKQMLENQANMKIRENFQAASSLLMMFFNVFPNKLMLMLRWMLKISMLWAHLENWLENIVWIVKNVVEHRTVTLKMGNLLTTMSLDVLIGIFVLRILVYYIGEETPSELLLENSEKVVKTLQRLINWLMGSPAGLKLNHSFNGMLGQFFLYNIHLWWTFLQVSRPVLEFAFKILMIFGKFGVTFQIAIIADLLALISFHSYCIYVYAARLFNIQFRGLVALFRLFLGKKKNPLRKRVDSCLYQPDQLFIGTLFFTILMFLLPTTWVYYTVFTMLRLIMIGLGGFLTRLRIYLQIMPVYTFFHWILKSDSVKNTVDIHLVNECQNGAITLLTEIMVSSWKETWQKCIPDTIHFCPSVSWSRLVKKVCWGELLYPL